MDPVADRGNRGAGGTRELTESRIIHSAKFVTFDSTDELHQMVFIVMGGKRELAEGVGGVGERSSASLGMPEVLDF